MDSSRFPGKVLADLAGHPILEHVVTRAQASGLPVVVATTDREVDDPIAAWAVTAGVKTFRWDGRVEDVLGRYIACAEEYDADAIVRVTADSPFVPVETIEVVVQQLRMGGNTVVAVTSGFGVVPDGWEAEGCLTDWLRYLDGSHPSASEREHVFPGIYTRAIAQGEKVPTALVTGSSIGYSGLMAAATQTRWNQPWLMQQKFSVDTPADLAWLQRITRDIDCTPPRPSAKDLMTLLHEHPQLQRTLAGRST